LKTCNALLTVFVLLFSTHIQAAETFAPLNKILKKYVEVNDLPGGGRTSGFKYAEAKKDPTVKKLVAEQIGLLKAFKPRSLSNKNDAIAFWINAYNFFIISEILESGFDDKNNLKIKGVKDLGSFLNPFKVFKKAKYNVGGETYSLDKIEKETLLGKAYKSKKWKDARVHFAVNCASVGCPPLRNEVYSGATLDAALDENLKKAFNTPLHLKIKDGKMELTQLFEWYEADFKEQSGSVKAFIQKYAEPNLAKKVGAAKISDYIKYDWNLNSAKNVKNKLR